MYEYKLIYIIINNEYPYIFFNSHEIKLIFLSVYV